jgi:uncharacterized membrane-anchored protein YjiN (DUF445 family)
MSDATAAGTSQSHGQVKTLAVRISEDLRAQLDVIAQLNDRSVTEEIRLAIESWIQKTKDDPSVQQRAESVRAELEREATTKRNAISAIFEAKATSAPGVRRSKE